MRADEIHEQGFWSSCYSCSRVLHFWGTEQRIGLIQVRNGRTNDLPDIFLIVKTTSYDRIHQVRPTHMVPTYCTSAGIISCLLLIDQFIAVQRQSILKSEDNEWSCSMTFTAGSQRGDSKQLIHPYHLIEWFCPYIACLVSYISYHPLTNKFLCWIAHASIVPKEKAIARDFREKS